MAQDLDQVLRAELGSSTGAVRQAGQPDLLLGHNLSLLAAYLVDYSMLDTRGRLGTRSAGLRYCPLC